MDFPAYVPGYAVDGPLGTNGTVWAGREEVTGAVVALRLLPLADPSARERARREVAMLTAVDHPHVLPLLGVVDVSGALVLVLELAEGGSLDDLLVARGTLSPGEVVTACAPIAQALAELHDHGIVHGQVAADSVLFSADGKPMLANLGTAVPRRNGPSRVVPPELQAGFPAQPGTDVYGLAAVAVRSLTGYAPNQALMLPGVPPATQSALAQAMHSDPDRRPAASFLANALFVLADPEPVVLAPNAAPSVPLQPDPAAAAEATELPVETSPAPRSRRAARRAQAAESAAPTRLAAAPAPTSTIEAPPISPEIEPEPRRRRRRRLRRVDLARFAMVVAIPVILAGAVFAALQLWGGGDGDTEALPGATRVTSPGAAEVPVDLCGGPQPAPSEQPPEVGDWTQVVQSLYLMRAEAFNEVDAQALCDVYAPTSQALADDAELLQLYADAGVHTRGLAFEVITAELVSQEAGRVVLEITDRLPPYELVNSSGAVKAEKEGLPEATWQAVLVPSPDASGWRFG